MMMALSVVDVLKSLHADFAMLRDTFSRARISKEHHVTCILDHVTCILDHMTCILDHMTCILDSLSAYEDGVVSSGSPGEFTRRLCYITRRVLSS